MLRSMFSAVSGLRGHQTFMDVIGNNIANVNTAGFKSSQVVFQDLLSQTIRSAGAPTSSIGGTNPAQVGLGSRIGAITTNFSQGSAQLTGRSTDVSIQGDGFFIVNSGGQTLYTRAGNFSFDGNGNLTTPDGAIVQGWLADTSGVINTSSSLSNLRFTPGQIIAPTETTTINMSGNLPSNAATGDTATTSITVYDSRGEAIPITFTFTKTANADEWEVQPSSAGGNIGSAYTVVFDPATGYEDTSGGSYAPMTLAAADQQDGTWTGDIAISFGTAGDTEAMSQFAGSTSAAASSQDGAAVGTLLSFAIGEDGSITGIYSNGKSQVLGMMALANFNNPAGLEKVGGSMYRESVDSGVPRTGTANSGGRGALAAGTLEMSNVDLAQEFTNLIVAQRGFQANSKVITVSDEILGDLISMKR